MEAAPVVPPTSDEILVLDVVAGIQVHVEETVGNLVPGTENAYKKALIKVCRKS